jgi:GDSL-like lipase/acylhydrolase family protein
MSTNGRSRSVRGLPVRHAAPRRRSPGRWAVIGLAVAVIAGGVAVAASRHATAGGSAGFTSLFYLDVGASASLGVQPTGNPAHNGAFTAEGYGNDIVRLEAARGVTVTLDKVGCMGETAQSMVGSGDHCYKMPVTQLSTAIAFLEAHQSDPGIVSVDIGFNDVRPCLWVVPLAGACAEAGIAAVKKDEPTILHELTAAAGPRVRIVGLTYADPFLYRYFKPAPGPARATQSLTYMGQLNDALRSAYTAAGVAVADVAAVFKTGDTAPTTLAGHGAVPTDVAMVCELTWMCAKYPFGPDDHPNKTGYTVIARTILAALPSSW